MGRTATRREELRTLEANLKRAQAKVDSGYGGGQAVAYYKEQIEAKKRQIEREGGGNPAKAKRSKLWKP